ncbi:hypothetical protein OCU04_008538 [Sclerotinia nivalis]|uniref:Protein argonaute N-terminal domain-containing protein n=1 Tax=Sclerotinia nivalis TaxID=352851 RepID=A0A9X0AJC1_9HELO|nr:hypothetical protein OCU04_008538 [Sclerotinia nivalis]
MVIAIERNCAACAARRPPHRRTRTCSLDPDVNPWPKQSDPLKCDFCEESHEPIDCPEHKKTQIKFNICGKCGHGWHSGTECMLDPRTPHLFEQFTPRKYGPAKMRQDSYLKFESEKEQGKLNAQSPSSKSLASGTSTALPTARPLTSGISTPNPTTPGNVGGTQLGYYSANVIQFMSSLDLGSQEAQKQEMVRRREEKKANHKRWAESAALNFEKFDDSVNTNGMKIKANLFKVGIKGKNIDLRRYHAIFGQIQGRDVTKASLKRTMMETMFNVHPPAAAHYATNYSLHIISVGKLYKESGDAVGSLIKKSHPLTPRPGNPPSDMTISIEYDGPVNLSELQDYLNQNAKQGYVPDEDLKALNIISWQKIYMSSFAGGKI